MLSRNGNGNVYAHSIGAGMDGKDVGAVHCFTAALTPIQTA